MVFCGWEPLKTSTGLSVPLEIFAVLDDGDDAIATPEKMNRAEAIPQTLILIAA
jgi:hypothetical protein